MQEHFKSLFFGDGPGTVRHYYQEVSGGLVNIEGEVIGPVTAPRKIKEYAHSNSGTGDESPNVQTMALDVAKLADPQVCLDAGQGLTAASHVPVWLETP